MVAGLAQIAGLWLFHATPRQVVLVQVYLMAGLFVAVLLWDSWLQRQRDQAMSSYSRAGLARGAVCVCPGVKTKRLEIRKLTVKAAMIPSTLACK